MMVFYYFAIFSIVLKLFIAFNKKIIYTIFNYYKVIKSNDEESSNLQKL